MRSGYSYLQCCMADLSSQLQVPLHEEEFTLKTNNKSTGECCGKHISVHFSPEPRVWKMNVVNKTISTRSVAIYKGILNLQINHHHH
jgi:hypothetical protein